MFLGFLFLAFSSFEFYKKLIDNLEKDLNSFVYKNEKILLDELSKATELSKAEFLKRTYFLDHVFYISKN